MVLSAAGANCSAYPLSCSCCSAGGCASETAPRVGLAVQDYLARQRLGWPSRAPSIGTGGRSFLLGLRRSSSTRSRSRHGRMQGSGVL
jgi:hypothetical protein